MLSALGLQVWWLLGCMNTLPPPWQEAITWCPGRPKGDAHRYPQGAARALPPFICPQAVLGVFASSWLPSRRTRLSSGWEIFLLRPSLSNSWASSLMCPWRGSIARHRDAANPHSPKARVSQLWRAMLHMGLALLELSPSVVCPQFLRVCTNPHRDWLETLTLN